MNFGISSLAVMEWNKSWSFKQHSCGAPVFFFLFFFGSKCGLLSHDKRANELQDPADLHREISADNENVIYYTTNLVTSMFVFPLRDFYNVQRARDRRLV